MPRARAERRYLIEIRDAEGSVVFAATAFWDDKDKRSALAQIERLARLPEVNFYAGRALAPQSDESERQRRPRMRLYPDSKYAKEHSTEAPKKPTKPAKN